MLVAVVFLLAIAYILYVFVSQFVEKKSVKADESKLMKEHHFPILSAHRGGASTFGPENVMETYRKSVHGLNIDMLEIDVHQTKDGHYVIMHDKTVDRTTNGKGKVNELTLADIQKLDAACKWTGGSGSGSLAGKGIKVPTLDQVLDEFVPKQDLIIYFDIKDINAIDKVFSEIKKRNISDRVIIGATDRQINDAMLKVKPKEIPCTPDVRTMYFVFASYWLGLFRLLPIRHHILGLTVKHHGITLLSKSLVDAFHSRGVKVAVFGPELDTAENQLLCLDCGVDILVSDRPDLLKETYNVWAANRFRFK